ncbi:hypothetical protein ACTMTU_18125 [Streptomyces sp. OZ13]|uniref:hypothetical protein n=1 Tax=Streptomyces sp. OZ13 TaxID=3452210 RepID=UPI003F8CB3D0
MCASGRGRPQSRYSTAAAEREVGAARRAVLADIPGPGVVAREDFAMLCESLPALYRVSP